MKRVYRVLHAFCGMGGKGLGAKKARAVLGDDEAVFETVGGIDIDPLACHDFEMLVGAPSLCLDVHKLEPEQLRAFAGDEAPDVVMMSPPCKGFSGLLSAKRAAEPHYQEMNRLMLRALFLMSETWDRPPALVFLENVPRIASRGKDIIRQAKAIGAARGYLMQTGTHDCGELGGLAQHRRRWFMVWRDPKQVPNFLYVPPKKRVRACGEVLGPLPIPGDTVRGGPMHSVPNLSWCNWLRLALIPAGGDWRDLPGVLEGGQKRREKFRRAPVTSWESPSETVTGPGGSSSTSIADPRIAETLGVRPMTEEERIAWEQRGERGGDGTQWFKGKYGVQDWNDPARTVVGGPSNGVGAVADPRFGHVERVTEWTDPVGAITSSPAPSSGAAHDGAARRIPLGDAHHMVVPVSRPRVGDGACAIAVADPRVQLPDSEGRHWNKYAVNAWDESAQTVIGAIQPGSGAPSIADPRIALEPSEDRHRHKLEVLDWDQSARTVTGTGTVGGGAPSVADPRWGGGRLGVVGFDEPAQTVTGEAYPSTGPHSVADPRIPVESAHRGVLGVTDWNDPSATVTGNGRPQSGRFAVADPRFADGKKKNWQQVAGVTPWTEPAPTVTSGAKIHGGAFQVADPRIPTNSPPYRVMTLAEALALDLRPDRPPPFIPIIIAADGTWHRPLTTLELGVLQSFPAVLDGKPLVLATKGRSGHTSWRERIGNAVPPDAAEEMANQMLLALLTASLGAFTLSNNEVWVAPNAEALVA